MTNKEFRLDEKIRPIFKGSKARELDVISVEDIKQAIKLLELENVDLMKDVLALIEIHKGTKVNLKSKLVLLFATHLSERTKIIGDKLIK